MLVQEGLWLMLEGASVVSETVDRSNGKDGAIDGDIQNTAFLVT